MLAALVTCVQYEPIQIKYHSLGRAQWTHEAAHKAERVPQWECWSVLVGGDTPGSMADCQDVAALNNVPQGIPCTSVIECLSLEQLAVQLLSGCSCLQRPRCYMLSLTRQSNQMVSKLATATPFETCPSYQSVLDQSAVCVCIGCTMISALWSSHILSE